MSQPTLPTAPTTRSADPRSAGHPTAPAPGEPRVPGAGGQAPPRPRATAKIVLSVLGVLASVVLAVVTLFSGGPDSVPAADVAGKLTSEFGAPVSCTQDLPATVGATVGCTGTDPDGTVHRLLVTATNVDGSTVAFTAVPQD